MTSHDTSATNAGARPSYRQVLRDCPDYRLLFLARSVSLCGDWFSLLATVALLRSLTGSNAKALSGMLILRLLPIFLAGPVAGVVADRFSRKTIMIVSDLARVVLVLALLAAPWTPFPIPFVYSMILLAVVASAFFEPARSAAIPQIVPDRYLSTANAMGAVMWSVMFTLGAAIGGIVTDLFGWRTALVIDAGTYLVSALLVLHMQLPRRKRREAGPVDWLNLTGLRDIRDGLLFIRDRPNVATVLLIKTGWGLAGAVTLLLTLFGERTYTLAGRPDLGVTLLYVARALGTGIGPLIARRIVPDETPRSMRRLIAGAFFWSALWYFGFSLVRNAWLAAACVVVAHCGGSVLWVYSSVLLQRMVPDEFRGRVMSTDLGLATLAISLSTWLYGVLAAAPGADLRFLVRVMVLSLALPLIAWWFAARRWPVGLRLGRPELDRSRGNPQADPAADRSVN